MTASNRARGDGHPLGMIGVGAVAEHKSGPAFAHAVGGRLVAVARDGPRPPPTSLIATASGLPTPRRGR